MKRDTFFILLLFASAACIFFSCKSESKRQVVGLNGKWEVAKTGGSLPETFASVTRIPGLVDLAAPSLDTADAGYQDGWYWHKRTFDLADTSFDIINLKIYKAKYHTKVYINGHFAGENYYCFTPSYYDIKPFLSPAGRPNEILIGVGCKSQLPDTIPDGNDFEKRKYIPGIYDNVEITLSNKPFINNIQCVPDITNEKLRVIAEIETENTQGLKLSYRVSESVSRRKIAAKTFSPELQIENNYVIADFEIDMKEAKRWSPESPFLYELTLSTGTDDKSVRFGMRSFRFDPEKRIALLNEEPYYLRGTNVCIFRFFEDPDRGTLPWDSQWPVTLHEKFKDMHWHMARYCIGFPPERWYDICDSIGFMLQDEYPIWWTTNREMAVDAPYVAEEYRRWMRERWNHPSVVIWDAQNETLSPQTGLAAKMVRELDLSRRPWENGWSEPIADTDPCEAHPYLFYKYRRTDVEAAEGYKKEFFGKAVRPEGDASFVGEGKFKDTGVYFKNPQLINEYGYIWLNRNGTTTTLTDHIYDVLWDGSNLTPRERLYIYARNLAMLTEYWRVHRKVAGVLHFCGLAYSRPENPRGQTSDHWVDIRNLTFEPEFYKYVKPAFSPVGLMIDTWEKEYPAASKQDIPVYVINDLKAEFEQEVVLTVLQNDRIVSTHTKAVTVKGYEVEMVPFEITLPGSPGDYQMKAEITVDGNNVFSLRDIPVKKNE